MKMEIRSLDFLIFVGVLFHGTSLFGQEPSKSELVGWIKAYEESYFGTEVVVSSPGGNFDPPVVRISRSGEVLSQEMHSESSATGSMHEETSIGMYSCPEFSISLNNLKRNGSPMGGLYQGAVGPTGDLRRRLFSGLLLGNESITGKTFSQIVESPSSKINFSNKNLFGSDGFEFVVIRPKQATVSFFFTANPPGRLLGVEFAMKKGDQMLDSWAGFHTLGERDTAGYESIVWKAGPISYDGQNKPKSVPTIWTVVSNPKKEPITNTESILSYKTLDEDLPSDRAVFTMMKIPRRIPIDVYGSTVPHELRDGKLVSLLDGKAIEVGSKVGFRAPEGMKRHIWILYFGLLLGLLVGMYFVVRKRKHVLAKPTNSRVGVNHRR